MEISFKKIRNYFAERTQTDMRNKAVEMAEAEIYPTCRTGEKGELINEIVVCGMPLFQVSNNDGRWNVRADDVGEVIKHLRDAYVENYMNQ